MTKKRPKIKGSRRLPPPLVSAEVELRSFQFLPIDINRLLKSDTWMGATSQERAGCIGLWLNSWHQMPAGSLPDDDRMLAKFADVEDWHTVRDYCLKGWIRCSDGRLYHPVVVEKVKEAWTKKLLHRERSRLGNTKRWGSKESSEANSQTDAASIVEGSRKESLKDRNREGEGQGKSIGFQPKKRQLSERRAAMKENGNA